MPTVGNPGSGRDSDQSQNRRVVLKGGAAALATLLAGCAGDDGGGGETTTTTATTEAGTDDETDTTIETETTTTEEALDPLLSFPVGNIPDNHQYNMWNKKSLIGHHFRYDHLGYTHFGLEDTFWKEELAQNWEFSLDERTFRVELKDSTWWDGKPYTSDDLWTHALMEITTEGTAAYKENTSEFKTPDERTGVYKLRGSVNPTVYKTQIIRDVLASREKYYGQFTDRVKNARQGDGWDQEELDAIGDEVINHRIEEVNGNSLFKLTSITPDRLEYELNEGHFAYDDWAAADGHEKLLTTNETRTMAMFETGEIDASGGLEGLENVAPDHAERIEFPTPAGAGMAWQQANEPWDQVEVRQAFAYIIDRGKVAKTMTEFHHKNEIVTGIGGGIESKWIAEEELEKYPRYPTDHTKAEELLQEADGLTKPGDWWHYNEERLEAPITFDSGSGPKQNAYRTVSDQIDRFGIKSEIDMQDGSKFWSDMYWQGRYEIGRQNHGGRRVHPFRALWSEMVWERKAGSYNYPGSEKHSGMVEAPMPIGNPDGEMETFDVPDLMDQLAKAGTEEENRRLIGLLGWIYSQTLPQLRLVGKVNHQWLTTDHWNIPPEDSKHRDMKSPLLVYWRHGLLTPKTE